MSRKRIIGIVALALGIFPLPALAGGANDRAFLEQAIASVRQQNVQATAHYADSNLSVRTYAHKIMKDYASIDSSLSSFATASGIPVQIAVDEANTVRPFFANDGLWVQDMIDDQRRTIASFQYEASVTGDARLRRLALTSLSILRADLELARGILAGMVQRAVASASPHTPNLWIRTV